MINVLKKYKGAILKMDKAYFIGSFKGVDVTLVDMSLADRILDESGNVHPDFIEYIKEFTLEVKEDKSFEMQEQKSISGRWIDTDDGIGLIPDEDYEKLVELGMSDLEIAMPVTVDGDGVLVDIGPMKYKFVK